MDFVDTMTIHRWTSSNISSEPDVHFVHAAGFIAKTSATDSPKDYKICSLKAIAAIHNTLPLPMEAPFSNLPDNP